MFIIDDIIEIGLIVAAIINGLATLGKVIMDLGKALGLVEKEEKIEDLGDKAIQAEGEGITPDQFETYDDYVKAVENFEVDPEKSKEIPEGDKVEKALELLAENAKEKYGIEPETTFGMIEVLSQQPKFFSECGSMIAQAIKENPEFAGAMNAYIKGQERNEANLSATTSQLAEMEKAAHPGMSDLEARQAVAELRNK